MKRIFCKSVICAIVAGLLSVSCAKEKLFDLPVGSWDSYMTEYYMSGTALDPYTSNKTAYYEKITFDASGKCAVTVNKVEREYNYTFEKNVITIENFVKFKVVQLTGMTLVLAIDVEGDPNAKSVYEYDRGEEFPVIYSNYTSFEGTENRCFWYLDGKKKRFCYPIIAAIYGRDAFDEMSKISSTLPFYDQIQYHFRKAR